MAGGRSLVTVVELHLPPGCASARQPRRLPAARRNEAPWPVLPMSARARLGTPQPPDSRHTHRKHRPQPRGGVPSFNVCRARRAATSEKDVRRRPAEHPGSDWLAFPLTLLRPYHSLSPPHKRGWALKKRIAERFQPICVGPPDSEGRVFGGGLNRKKKPRVPVGDTEPTRVNP
jgi:hypothetical protein